VGEGYRAPTDDTPRDRQRLIVPDAARALGISPEAVRNRLSRGTLESVKESGTVYVLIDRDIPIQGADISGDRPVESGALISEMRSRIESLERQLEIRNEELREHRRLLAAALERIPPAIEAPQEPRESPETTESTGPRERRPFTDEERAQEAAQPRSWWRRMFGG
jgi:hypothetical protein